MSAMVIDWDDLIAELRAAQHKMSQKNEHRKTLWKAEQALTAVRQALREHSRMESAHGHEEDPRSV
jgi:hypothetical protein